MKSPRFTMRTIMHAFGALALLIGLYTPVAMALGSLRASFSEVWLLAVRSCLLAIGAGCLASAIGAAVALLLWEGVPRRARATLLNILYATAGIPSAATAVAVLLAFPKLNETLRLVIALTISIAPYAARYLTEDLSSLPKYAVDASRALGSNGLRMVVDVILPYAKNSLLSTFLYAVARAFVETAALSILLSGAPRFLAVKVAAEPLSPAAFPAALILCIGAMLLYDRAQFLRGRR